MAEVVCSCGALSPATARFCASCGSPLAGAAPAPAAPPAPPLPSVDQQVLDTLRGFVAPQVADRISGDAGRPVEERRLVTALFADLSGFTTLAARLDPDELLAVIDPVVSGLTRIVSRYDGYVEKFAGDALLALFGAPTAHEDDAARALAVALDMQAELGSLSDHPEARGLTLHVGVNTGTVVARVVGSEARMDYAVLGEAVILAQRLESLAPSGSVYVGALTRQLAGPAFAFDDLGALAVKGRAEPVPAYRLVGRRAAGLWDDPGLLVGRADELGRLRATLDAVRAGGSARVRIGGPAGSGKSRLLAELRNDAAAAGVTVVELVGASHAQSPYRCLLPFVEAALRARYPQAPDLADRLDRAAEDAYAPAPAALTAVLAGRAGAVDELGVAAPDAVRHQLGDAALAWLVDLAARGPLLLAADGLHWFDAASREVLDGLAAELPAGVLLCRAGRDEPGEPEVEVEAPTPKLDLLLGPLPRAAVGDLVVAELSLVPDDRLLDHLEARGQGNPLMVRELVRQLRAEGLLDVQHGHVRLVAGAAADSVPASLEALVAARLDALAPALLRVATTAAVIGFATQTTLLATVCGIPRHELDARVVDLVRAGLLRPVGSLEEVSWAPGRVRFESALIRDLLYGRLTSRRRQELHARVADALVVPPEPDDELVALLAEHRYLAGDLAEALPWLRSAAAYARRLFAQDTAAHTLVRAVRCARTIAPDQLPELLVELAEVRAEGGELDAAADLYAEARRGGVAGGVNWVGNDALAWAGGVSVLRRQGRYADALALVDAADAAHPAGDLRLLAQERARTLSVSGDLEGCRAAAGAGLAAGDPDDRVAGLLLLQLMRSETLLGDRPAAHEHAARALANLERAGDAVGLCMGLRLLGWLHQISGDLDAAAATLLRGLELARRVGLVEEIGGCQINLGLVYADHGDHRAAEQSYRDAATTFERAGFEAGRAMAYGNRSCELLALGEYEDARRLGLEALALADRIGDPLTAGDVHQTLALVAERTGDVDEARRQADEAIAGFVRAGAPAEASQSQELLARLDALV